ILDKERRILAHLAGRPDDFDDVVAELNRVFAEAESKLKLCASQRRHRRGRFSAVSVGISFGGGQTEPMNLCLSSHNEEILEALMSNWAMTRLVGYVNTAFGTVHPHLHRKYSALLDSLLQHHPHIRCCFNHSVFAACTVNVGRVVSQRHHDSLNLILGVCAITCGGDFDYTKGGHLILWDLKLVVQFPPGSTILIPSAILEHSNVPIADGETRWSFTQFTVAGLFRWVDNGFQSDKDVQASFKHDPEAEAAYYEKREAMAYDGLTLLSTL
ncbi:hypothetical protein BDZ89DRAFT_959757, partial [Hymenopellis radicata]